jgi:hypothetical protein
VPVHFAHTVHDCFNMNFPSWWSGRGGRIAWPLILLMWSLWPFFGGNSKYRSLQQLQMVQSTHCSASGKRWTIGIMYAELQMALTVKCFAPKSFSFLCKKLFQLMNKLLQTTPSHLFSFPSYRCLTSNLSFW